MTPSEIARRIDEEITQAEVDLRDARRCQALHLQPSTGTLLRRVQSALTALRQARDEIARLSAQESPEPLTDAEIEAAYLAYNGPGDGWERMRVALLAARGARYVRDEDA